jgi:hypothetical protein
MPFWLSELKMMFSSSIDLPANDKISFFFVASYVNSQDAPLLTNGLRQCGI